MRYCTVADSHPPEGVALATPAPKTGMAAKTVTASAGRLLRCCERDKVSLCGDEGVGGGSVRAVGVRRGDVRRRARSDRSRHFARCRRSEASCILATFHNSRQSFTSSPRSSLRTRSPYRHSAPVMRYASPVVPVHRGVRRRTAPRSRALPPNASGQTRRTNCSPPVPPWHFRRPGYRARGDRPGLLRRLPGPTRHHRGRVGRHTGHRPGLFAPRRGTDRPL